MYTCMQVRLCVSRCYTCQIYIGCFTSKCEYMRVYMHVINFCGIQIMTVLLTASCNAKCEDHGDPLSPAML